MSRTPPAGYNVSGTSVIFLLEAIFWDGASDVYVRLCSATQDIDYDANGDSVVETYTGAGDFLSWGPAQETTDRRGQGVELVFSGVSTTVMATLLGNYFKGRAVRIWRATGDPAAGTIDEAWLVHRGLQLSDYEIQQNVPEDPSQPITCTISTRSTSRMAMLQRVNTVKTNMRSHNSMLDRAGLATGDTGLFYTKQLPGRVFWGTEAPDGALSGQNAGGSGGTGGGGGGGPSGPTGPRTL